MAPGCDRTVRRIVRTENGPGTGETIYVDQYGDRWITRQGPFVDQTCQPMTGRIEGGHVITGK